MLENCPQCFRGPHFKPFPIVFTDKYRFRIGNSELNADERSSSSSLQFSRPLMCGCEVWDDRHRKYAPNSRSALYCLEANTENGLLVILVCDMNERDHNAIAVESIPSKAPEASPQLA